MILDIYAHLMAAGVPPREIDRMDILRYLDVMMRKQARGQRGEGGVPLDEDGLPTRRGTIDEVLG